MGAMNQFQLNMLTHDAKTFANPEDSPKGAKVGDAGKFMLAGHALFIVLNRQTGNRFTYKVTKHDSEEDFYWVGVLTGPDNTASYTSLGRIVKGQYHHNRNSKITETAQSNKAFDWFYRNLSQLPDFIEVWHCGYCCVCGRLLTTPESVASGIGPVCAGR